MRVLVTRASLLSVHARRCECRVLLYCVVVFGVSVEPRALSWKEIILTHAHVRLWEKEKQRKVTYDASLLLNFVVCRLVFPLLMLALR